MATPTTPHLLVVLVRILCLANLGTLGLLFVSAGQLVQYQNFRGLDIHGFGAIGIHLTSGLLAVAVVLLAFISKSGLFPAVIAVSLFGLTFLQAALGSAVTLTFHISGSLVLTVMATWLSAWAFSSRRHSAKSQRPGRDPLQVGASS